MNGEPVVESKVRILVVEDELIIAKGIEKRLKLLGYAVADTVASGEEAVEKALEILPDLFAGDPDRLARFAREAKTLAPLNHPNIAQIC